jgi:hypothetical protein
VKGKTIGAAPLVELTFRHLLAENGIDLERDKVKIVDVKRAHEPGVSFGVAAAKALEDGQIDGFWANAMGAPNAIRSGRRQGGARCTPRRRAEGGVQLYLSRARHERQDDRPRSDMVAAANACGRWRQRAWPGDGSLAAKVGEKLFSAA